MNSFKSFRSIAVLSLLIFAIVGCGKRSGITGPDLGSNEPPPPPSQTYTKIERLEATAADNHLPSLAAGAEVYLSGTLASRVNPEAKILIGSIDENGELDVDYVRTVQGGETFSVCLWAKYGDEYHRILNFKINEVDLTALAWDEHGINRVFQVDRINGQVVINTLDVHTNRLVPVRLVYTGVDPQLPTDSELNNPASETNVAKFSSTWSATSAEHFAAWDPSTSTRMQPIIAIKGDTTLVRFNVYDPRKGYIDQSRAGCFAVGPDGQMVELINLRDIDARPDYAWYYFEFIVDESGHVVNPRPDSDERYFDIGIGRPRPIARY